MLIETTVTSLLIKKQMNGACLKELIVNNINAPAYIYENQSVNNNWLKIQLTDNQNNTPVFGTKISNVRGMYSTSENVAHFGLGTTTMIDEVSIILPNGKQIIQKNIKTNQLLKIDINQEKNYPKKEKSALEKTLFTPIKNSNLNQAIHQENIFGCFWLCGAVFCAAI